jgi:hypothetical protein
MHPEKLFRFLLTAVAALAVLGLSWGRADAVPSYARQTGFSCAACHTVYPELTPLGRRFKLTGYLLTTTPSQGTSAEEYVLNRTPPISAMVMVSETQTQKSVPDPNSTVPGGTSQNNSVAFPQQVSFFYAGRISPNTGAFIQITYSGQDDHFSMDNTDIRMVDQGAIGNQNFVYGLTLNNNPGVQDLWNSTPAFGYPYASSASAPAQAARIQLDGSLAQQVAGLGGYVAWLRGSSYLYGELSLYQSSQPGSTQPLNSGASSPVVRDQAPYARVAYETNWSNTSLEVGTLAMMTALSPTSVTVPDPTGANPTTNQPLNKVSPNRFYDSGVDAQWEYIPSDETIFTVKGLWLHEDQMLGADAGAAHLSNSLDTQRLTGSYYYNRKGGVIAQWFATTGSSDTGLYPSTSTTAGAATFRTNSPNTSGYIVELVYNPYLNTRYSLQYTAYDKFNGAATNYDGNGRNASDNNTTYLLAWLMF